MYTRDPKNDNEVKWFGDYTEETSFNIKKILGVGRN